MVNDTWGLPPWLERGVADLFPAPRPLSQAGPGEFSSSEALATRLVEAGRQGRPLRVKLGIDPTGADIHLGHSILFRKLRAFQDAGHTAVLIIGDFTARIGDPTGKSATRVQLTAEVVAANARTYLAQLGQGQPKELSLLDFETPGRLEVRRNSEWLAGLDLPQTIELLGISTVGQMLAKEDFANRYGSGTPISLHEFLYPLLQGYDSVAIEADLELGGTDQKFNLLMGRHLQAEYGQEPQCILTMPLLEGTDGVDKMSKSKNNYIGISEEPNTMFAKVMGISDVLMWRWYTLLSFHTEAQIAALKAEVEGGRNPRDAKVALAKEITARFHSAAAADAAEQDFVNRSKGGIPDEIAEISLPLGTDGAAQTIGALLKSTGLAASTGEGNRLIDGGGVRVDSQVVSDKGLKLGAGTYVVQVGKRKFVRLTLA